MTDDFDLIAFLERLRSWGFETFGHGERRQGVCDHIRREIEEIEVNPCDAVEWADVILLAFAGLFRAGVEPKAIERSIGYLKRMDRRSILSLLRSAVDAAEGGENDPWIDVVNLALLGLEGQGYPREAAFHLMIAKQIANEDRKWPDWRQFKEGEVIEHVRSAS